MPSQSLADLQQQARLTYVYWPLWLLLKQGRIEQLLSETTVSISLQNSAEVDLLRELGLPLPADLSPYTSAAKLPLEGSHFAFELESQAEQIWLILKRWNASGKEESCQLMSIQAQNRWYLDHAVQQLNQGLAIHPAEDMLHALRFWIGCHGIPAPSLDWKAKANDLPQTVSSWE